MLTKRIIPCLDTRGGRVVKGVKFQQIRDAGSPVALAAKYQDEGADEIVMLDITATIEGRATTIETVKALRSVLMIPLTVGGGVRSVSDAKGLLESGADKIAINSAAISNPGLVEQLASEFGSQCVTVAIDAAENDSGWSVYQRGGRERVELSAVEWSQEVASRGAGELLVTSIDRDGTKSGYDLQLIAAIAAAVSIPVIASGGAHTVRHLVDAIRAGADAVLAASIFHDAQTTVSEIKMALSRMGLEVRQ